jgi:hypothetical protein
MKHILISGDFAQSDVLLGKILAAHGKHVKGVTVVHSAIVVQPQASPLQILGQSQQSPITFQNISTVTILYQLPGDAEIDLTPFLPETAPTQKPS